MTIKLTGLEEGAVFIVYYRPDLFLKETIEVFSERYKAEDYIKHMSTPEDYHLEMRFVL